MTTDKDQGQIRYLNEIREPGYGWSQQAEFIRIIDTIGDENDRLVKLLRSLRMCVGPKMPLREDHWEMILLAAKAVLDIERLYAEGKLGGEEPE